MHFPETREGRSARRCSKHDRSDLIPIAGVTKGLKQIGYFKEYHYPNFSLGDVSSFSWYLSGSSRTDRLVAEHDCRDNAKHDK